MRICASPRKKQNTSKSKEHFKREEKRMVKERERAGELFGGKLLITVEETAKALSLAPRTVYNGISRGDFPLKPRRHGRAVRFKVEDVVAYVDSL